MLKYPVALGSCQGLMLVWSTTPAYFSVDIDTFFGLAYDEKHEEGLMRGRLGGIAELEIAKTLKYLTVNGRNALPLSSLDIAPYNQSKCFFSEHPSPPKV